MSQLFKTYDSIALRKLDDDCVAFSGFSGETVLLHPISYRILIMLSVKPYTLIQLLTFIQNDQTEEETSGDINGFLDDMLLDLVNRGFIHSVN